MADNLSETQKQATIPDFFQAIKKMRFTDQFKLPYQLNIQITNLIIKLSISS